MRKEKWLVCGSRIKNNPKYKDLVFNKLDKYYSLHQELFDKGLWELEYIIQGKCPDSADVYAIQWALERNIPVKDFHGKKGHYLTRNAEMVMFSDEVIAFWNGYSYGTAQTIGQAILQGKAVTVIDLFKELKYFKGKIGVKND